MSAKYTVYSRSLQSCKLHKRHNYLRSIPSLTLYNIQIFIIKAKLYRVGEVCQLPLEGGNDQTKGTTAQEQGCQSADVVANQDNQKSNHHLSISFLFHLAKRLSWQFLHMLNYLIYLCFSDGISTSIFHPEFCQITEFSGEIYMVMGSEGTNTNKTFRSVQKSIEIGFIWRFQ